MRQDKLYGYLELFSKTTLTEEEKLLILRIIDSKQVPKSKPNQLAIEGEVTDEAKREQDLLKAKLQIQVIINLMEKKPKRAKRFGLVLREILENPEIAKTYTDLFDGEYWAFISYSHFDQFKYVLDHITSLKEINSYHLKPLLNNKALLSANDGRFEASIDYVLKEQMNDTKLSQFLAIFSDANLVKREELYEEVLIIFGNLPGGYLGDLKLVVTNGTLLRNKRKLKIAIDGIIFADNQRRAARSSETLTDSKVLRFSLQRYEKTRDIFFIAEESKLYDLQTAIKRSSNRRWVSNKRYDETLEFYSGRTNPEVDFSELSVNDLSELSVKATNRGARVLKRVR